MIRGDKLSRLQETELVGKRSEEDQGQPGTQDL